MVWKTAVSVVVFASTLCTGSRVALTSHSRRWPITKEAGGEAARSPLRVGD